MTFYENAEVGPPTKSNRGGPNETVTPLLIVRLQLTAKFQLCLSLNPLDKEVCGVVQQRVYECRMNIVDELKECLVN